MITISANGTPISIEAPQWGYSSLVKMAIKSRRQHDGTYRFADDDATGGFDYRIARGVTWLISTANKSLLSGFLRTAGQARAENISIELGSDATGFFPFGPDLGDKGTFVCRPISRDESGMIFQPWKYWEDAFDLVLVSAPAYSIPAEKKEGTFQIGTVTEIRYPQNSFSSRLMPGWSADISRTGQPESIDLGAAADTWQSEWTQECNQTKSAKLVQFLTGSSGRTADISIITGSGAYPFHIDNLSGGTFISKFIQDHIEIKHERWDMFSMKLKFLFRSAS